MQSIYCPYYVKLINNIIDENINITSIINKKSKEYQHMLSMENKKDLTTSEKETYDEFCEKIKNKTYKAGYSQFIGELFNTELKRFLKTSSIAISSSVSITLLDSDSVSASTTIDCPEKSEGSIRLLSS